MQFVLSDSLLQKLRDQRQQRRERAHARLASAGIVSVSRPLDRLRWLVQDERPTEKATTSEYVLDVETRYDAFPLCSSLGLTSYLTADGRVLHDGRCWDDMPLTEVTGLKAIASLVAGAKMTGISELLDLVPVCPRDGLVCPLCDGSRWEDEILCLVCRGRGWVLQSELDELRTHGYWPIKPAPKNV